MERPHRVAEIQNRAALAETWMLVDLDQLGSPNVGWAKEIPLRPVHGNTRTYLYFDNHVGRKKPDPKGKY